MANNPVLIGALLISAAMLAVLGTVLPGMLELEPPADWVLRGVLYAAALGDVAIALWFRSRMKRAAPPQAGGTVDRR